jgi:ABC-type glycerol-3-phosphate transport system permease component
MTPILVFIMMSFVPRSSVLSGVLDPATLTFSNYRELFLRLNVPDILTNSFVIAATSTALAVSLGLFVAYFVSRGRSMICNQIYYLSMTVWFVPAVSLSSQIYFWFQYIGLYDRLFGMIILYSIILASLSIVLLTPYFDGMPRRIDESAWIDGLSGLSVVWRIHLPVIRPVLQGISMIAFVMAWNELLYASLLSGRRVTTLPVAMLALTTGSHIEWGQIAALGTLSFLPVPIAILLFVRTWSVSCP